jgi:hypothetical protein
MSMRRLLLLGVAVLLAVNVALALVQPGLALPNSLGAHFFGPKLVRAEVILRDGNTIRDYRIDRGRVRAVTRDSITLLERDGTLVTIPVAPHADVQVGSRKAGLSGVKKGMTVTTIREGGGPATTIRLAR